MGQKDTLYPASSVCFLGFNCRKPLFPPNQFDAVWKNISVTEHLQLYAAIRGVPPEDIERLADQFMEGLRIKEHAKKYSNDCSGGTKRKLSYAMAMLGKPKIVLLDEPSTGMDPKSKRFVWDTILASFRVSRRLKSGP